MTAQGAVWAPPGGAGLLTAGAAVRVAAGQRAAYYSQAALDGVHGATGPIRAGLPARNLCLFRLKTRRR